MQLKLITFLFCLVTSTFIGQTIKVTGVVKDSIGALELANIIATVQETGDVESYAITNSDGKYQLHLPANNTYNLKVSYLGYKTLDLTITLGEDKTTLEKDFLLEPDANQLDGVELVYVMPVTVRGDTIVYNADSFSTGNERKLGDIMKNLPGVEINENGRIEVDGKEVTKVMIEGKDFFDGDSKLAAQNIPADAVDKIEVLKNFNEVSQMRGLGNDSDNVALNIKLKEGKKNFWFGEVTAGGGFGDEDTGRYLAHPKLFYYSPKYSINLITDFNNIGEVPFTFRDYFNFTGGFRNFSRGTGFNISDSDLGFAVAQNDRAYDIETNFFAGNFSYTPSKKWTLSGFGIYSDNQTDYISNSFQDFNLTNSTETNISTTNQRNQLAMLKLSAVFKPNTNFQLDYDVLIKGSKQTENANALSSTTGFDLSGNPITSSNLINENKDNEPFSINQNVNAYYTINEKSILAVKAQHLFKEEDPFYRAAQDVIPFRGIFTQNIVDGGGNIIGQNFDPLLDQNRFDVNQSKNVRSNKLDFQADLYRILNKKSNLNFTFGATLSRQDFDSNIFQVLDDSSINNFTAPEFNNDVRFDFSDFYFGLHYKFKIGIFTFSPGLSIHNYDVKSKQLGSTSSQNDWALLPDFYAQVDIKNSENIRFNYSITSEYTDVNNYAAGFVFNNYNRLFRGNRNLENALSQRFSLQYFNFNSFNFTNIQASLSYSRKTDAIKTSGDLSSITQVSTRVNLDSNFADETFSGRASFSKRFRKLQVRLGANVSLSKFNNIFNERVTESESLNQNYTTSIRSNFREAPNFELGYRLNINTFDTGNGETSYFTNTPYVSVDINFLKNFTLVGRWDFYNYNDDDDSTNLKNTYEFLEATLYYQKKDSNWEFSIQGSNLLDVDSINESQFFESYSSSSQFFVMPRIVMFSIKYDL